MESVTVLLSTYNGELYLKSLLDSVLSQRNVQILIFCRDDGSSDSTIDILNHYKKLGKLTYFTGENMGPAKSFMDIIKKVPTQSEYYAFCDQDDIWLDNKMEEAIKKMKNYGDKQPCLYFSNLTYVDSNLQFVKSVDQFNIYKCSFTQEFVRNYAAGCTIVYNKELLKYLKAFTPNVISMHDRWAYLVCSGVNGNIVADSSSYILYRQHQNNVTGNKTRLHRLLNRIKRVIDRDPYLYQHALDIKYAYFQFLTEENKMHIDKIINSKRGFHHRVILAFDKNFRLRSLLNNITFKIKILLNKF